MSRVTDRSQIAEARRAAATLAKAGGLDENGSGRVALAATEMATNLLKHAGGGEVISQLTADSDGYCIELLSLDGGAGIVDISRALEDGYSTAGSSGTGLGAIQRQADRFAIWSRPGLGTAIMARFRLPRRDGPTPGVTLGSVLVPFPGETTSGDAWSFGAPPAGASLLLADGLGHGPLAARAAGAAVDAFAKHGGLDCVSVARMLHDALRPTRGAALAVARIDTAQHVVRFVGIGNIAGAMLSEGVCRRMVSHNGTAGQIAPRISEFTYDYTGVPTVIMHSDGLSARWNLDTYPGLAAAHPSLIAGFLFHMHRRERDDACVVVMRATP
ncbi:MAG TPA: anti-sigma regulatory factor [Stellaceae bacterium]|nr:anti-sigma regulatory factor [Stellaceae bacterium]